MTTAGGDDRKPTRAEALRDLRTAFAEAGLAEAAVDARVLLLAALQVTRTELLMNPSHPLTREQDATLLEYRRRRLEREPVARILGEREFWGLPFVLSPDTLVPRPDTETVVETVLRLVRDRHAHYRIADLGTGSGALLVALLRELPRAIGLGLDRSLGAARTAQLNAARNDVAARSLFIVGDWCAALRGNLDFVVSNPPYIASDALQNLASEVRDHDPALALDGGGDGLGAYRIILSQAAGLLAPDGRLLLEIGFDQKEGVSALAVSEGYVIEHFATDLGGQPRCLALKRT